MQEHPPFPKFHSQDNNAPHILPGSYRRRKWHDLDSWRRYRSKLRCRSCAGLERGQECSPSQGKPQTAHQGRRRENDTGFYILERRDAGEDRICFDYFNNVNYFDSIIAKCFIGEEAAAEVGSGSPGSGCNRRDIWHRRWQPHTG